MAKACAISGKQAQTGRRIRNTHSIGWKYRAPKTGRKFEVNLQTVTVPLPGGGSKRIKVAARMLTSRAFREILNGQRPLPKDA